MFKMLYVLSLLTLSGFAAPTQIACAADSQTTAGIFVYALFQDKAVVMVNGMKRVLNVGERSPEGILLLSSDGDSATVEINGRREQLSLGTHLGSAISAPTQAEVRLYPDAKGMYFTDGAINGQSVRFLVDTGATLIAMNAGLAKRLAIDYRMGKKGSVETASGIENAFAITLKSVKVGAVELKNVAAVVLDGGYPTEVLLGMSFLGQLEMQHDAKHLVLRKKH